MTKSVPASPRLSVVIPARNEEAAVARVVQDVRRSLELAFTGWELEILVVDDGSEDETAAAARNAGAAVIEGGSIGGYGAALKRGIHAASGTIVCMLDGDGTYAAEDLPALVRAVEDGADLAIGVRPFHSHAPTLLRRFAKRFLYGLASSFAGTRIKDLNSGMRCFRRRKITPLLRLFPNGFSFTSTLSVAAALEGWRIAWMPIRYEEREGSSHFRPVRDTARLLLAVLRAVTYFAPLRLFLPAAAGVGLVGIGFLAWDVFVLENLTDKTVLSLLTSLELGLLGLIADMIIRHDPHSDEP